MTKIKILQIATVSSWGGAPQVVFDLVKNLDKNKFSVELACGTGKGWEKMKETGVKIYPLPNMRREIDPIRDLKTIWTIYRIIKKGNYNIVHCHSTKAGLVGRIAAKLAGTKRIYFTVHGWGFYNSEYKWAQKMLVSLEKIIARMTSKIICVSRNDLDEGIKNKITQKDRMGVIYNGIDFKNYVDRQGSRQIFGLEESVIVFGFVARLANQKNPQLFLKAAEKIVKKCDNANFIIIGDGPLMAECRKLSSEMNLDNKIKFLGELPNVKAKQLMSGFDVFVLSSRFEGLPLTVIEAMFAGLPIIAGNVGGIPELISDSKNGFLVNAGSVDELVQKMEYFIENPDQAISMGREGKKIAQEKFTLEKMVANYQNLYQNG